jgi:predicted ABC-type ATPase
VSHRRLSRDIHLSLAPLPQAAITRVAQRVSRGGHHIPDDVITRRYAAGLHNMRHAFVPLADVAFVYDNSQSPPLLIAEKRSNMPFAIRDSARWKLIEDATP